MIPRVRGPISCFTVLAVAFCAGAQTPLKFMGRDVTVTDPGTADKEGFSPKGPASVCLEGAPRQCYTMPDKTGGNPSVEIVEVSKDLPALLFSADSGGVSQTSIHFALLSPGPLKELEDLFLSEIWLSNQSQHEFWTVPEVSDAKMFVTAEFVWGPDEAHYDHHRFIVSSYLLLKTSLPPGTYYHLEDRYMTLKKFDYDKDDILASEKPEILARLLRVKQKSSGVR